ncbi:MAG: entericidin A/B family lipoprotein [Usitatibacteraceae bacterium]
MRKLFSSFAMLILLGGCNTIEGVGKDIKKSGEVIERAADKAKN